MEAAEETAQLQINECYVDALTDPSRYMVLKGGAGCFTADMLVTTKEGQKPISEVKPWEEVLSYNHNSQQHQFRKVEHIFIYKAVQVEPCLIKFSYKGNIFRCTLEHEFYDGNKYVPIYQLIWRTLEARRSYLLRKQQRPTTYKELEELRQNESNETSTGQQRVLAHNGSNKRQKQNNQDAPIYCEVLDSQPRMQAGNKPQERRQERQQNRKSGMGDQKRKPEALNGQRFAGGVERFKEWFFDFKRTTSSSDKEEIQTEVIHRANVSGRIWGEDSDNKRHCSAQILEAHLINDVELIEPEKVYDLCVQGNHNYFINDVLVHNSGKSVFCAQKCLMRLTTEPKQRILAVRKVKTTIRRSVFQLFKDLIDNYGLRSRFKIKEWDMEITDLYNGNTIFFAGVDDQEKMKSIQGVTSIWVEEASELDLEDLNQLDLRLRGETEGYKQIMLSFNPISINHWLKAEFFDNPPEDLTVIETTFRDNAFIDEEYKKMLLQRLSSNDNWFRIYVKNEWGIPTTGDEFYRCFKITKHVANVKYNPALPLHISYDFNVNPYMSLSVWQISGSEMYCLQTYAATKPHNNTRDITKMFVKDYYDHAEGVYIYGDPTGVQEDTRTEKGWNDYKIILSELPNHFRAKMRVAKAAPSVRGRGDFINAIFEYNYGGLSITIDKDCKEFIEDLSYLKEAPDGTKHKEKTTDKKTGIRFERYGHFSDNMDYFICEAFKNIFRQYQKAGSVKEHAGITGRDDVSSRKSVF